VTDDASARHRVWRIADPAAIDRMRAALGDATVLIADGHHRYETSLAYRELRRAEGDTDPEAPHNFAMMYLTSMDDPGLVVLPTHRVWRGALPSGCETKIAEQFETASVAADDLLARLDAETAPGCLGASFAGGRSLLLRLRDPARLDAALADMH